MLSGELLGNNILALTSFNNYPIILNEPVRY